MKLLKIPAAEFIRAMREDFRLVQSFVISLNFSSCF